jgi:hypothetical protein
MHLDVQIALVRCAGHAERRRDPQPEERIVSSYSLLVQEYRWAICAIHMHVANVQLSFILASLLRTTSVI